MEKRVFNRPQQEQPKPVMVKRTFAPRKVKTEEEWEEDILLGLSSSSKMDYLNVDKTGRLFRFKTLSTEQVPVHILHTMTLKGKLLVDDEGYYKVRPI